MKRLTPQEQRIVEELAVAGETNKEIGARLRLTPSTVKYHAHHAMTKTGKATRTALVLWWIRIGKYDYLDEDRPFGE